jgi:photosystem II stability/assembly factor-like uncharacterized protein
MRKIGIGKIHCRKGVNLFGVHFPDDTTGYSVGMDGTILKTINGGNDWFPQSSGVTTTFESVFFTDIDTGYVVGYANNTIHKTTNGGLDWVEMPDAAQSLTDVYFVNANLGYAVGSNGFSATIIKTTNGGVDWEAQHTGTVTFYNAVFFVNDTTGYVAGGGGRLLKTTNGGETWVTQTSGTTQTIQSLYFHDELNGYGASYGRIIKTTNGGATWTSSNIFQSYELYDIKFTDFNTGYAVGRSGIILKTTNAGASWSFLTTETNITLRSVYFTDAMHGVVVGENGITLKTTDAGLTWVPFSTSEYYENLNDAHFPSDCTGYAVGEFGTIIRTIDGGANWVAQNSGFSNHLFGVHFTSDEVGYVVGNTGLISKTTDGGATWSTQTSGITANLSDVFFTGVDTGYVVGSGGNILKTTDGGANWVQLVSNVTNSLTAIHFLDSDLGFVVGSSGRVMKTTNGGSTWNVLFSGTTLDLNSVFFVTPQIGYIAGVSGHIRKTINGGTNWTQLTNNINIALTSLAFIDENNGYAVGYDYNRYGKIYQTANGGTNWTVETISWDHELYAINYADPYTIYIVGMNGAILKNKMEATSISSSASVCEGESIHLNVPSITGASYSWSGPNEFSSALQNPTIEESNIAMDGDYTVLISVNNCTSTIESTTINVHPAPATPVINHNGQLCAGDQLSLSTQEVLDGDYTWTGPNGFFSNDQNPVVSEASELNMSGTYLLSISANGCTSELSEAFIEINNIPATPIITNDGPFCEGSTSSLSTAFVEDASYTWIGPNGFYSTDQNPILSSAATTDLAGIYQLVTFINGCSSVPAESSVLVNALPSTPVIFHEGVVCEGASFSLSTQNLPETNYTWTGPNGFSSIDQNPVVSELADMTMGGTYTLSTTANNCTSAAGEIVIVVIERPETPVISNNSPICEGSTSSLSTAFIEDVTYTWTGPNDFSSTDQNPILSNDATVDLNGIYYLTTTVDGCSSLAAETTVLVNEAPLTPIILNEDSICEGSLFMLSTESIPEANFTWTGPNGFNSAEQNPIVSSNSTVTMSGSYEVFSTIGNCSSASAQTSIIVNPIPESPIASSNGPVDVGTALILSATTITGADYFWTGPNGFTSTEQNPMVSEEASLIMAGDYVVIVTVNTCESEPSTVAVEVITINKVQHDANDFMVNVYPNPAKENMTIELSGFDFKQIQIVNTLGEIVLEEKISQLKTELNVHSLAAGIYMLVLRSEEVQIEEKIIKY